MPTYIIPCRVTLAGADMLVEANSPEEAMAKARRNQWDDIVYDAAELIDHEIRGEAVETPDRDT